MPPDARTGRAATRDDRITRAVDTLRAATAAHAPAVFTTSLGLEDMVLLDLIHRHAVPAEVVTLDTGRLHEETMIGPYRAVVPSISGTAWITGTSTYTLDPSDPFPEGFTVGDIW